MTNTKIISEEVKKIRHNLHAHPELSWQEIETSKQMIDYLLKIPGLEIKSGIAKTGVVATLKGNTPGPCIAFRADMDALPILEKNEFPHISKNKNIMHACGHDGHMSILLGTARYLASFQHQIKGTIKFIFQPAEEGGAGGKVMCEEGVLSSPEVDQIFALHGWPELPLGQIGIKSGTIMAATAYVDIEITGHGGHAAFPHLAVDPIIIGSEIVMALQTIASRMIAPTEPIVISITEFSGGNTHNVIPHHVQLKGTLRTLNEKTQTTCTEKITQICQNIAKAHGGSVKVTIKPGYPATINSPKEAEVVLNAAKSVVGNNNAIWVEHSSMGGEDFAYFLQQKPGAYFYLGLNPHKDKKFPSLHDPYFDFNDNAIEIGIKIFTEIAKKCLGDFTAV